MVRLDAVEVMDSAEGSAFGLSIMNQAVAAVREPLQSYQNGCCRRRRQRSSTGVLG